MKRDPGVLAAHPRAISLALSLVGATLWFSVAARAGDSSPTNQALRKLGQRIFVKAWKPAEPSRHGGDGLGPLYNEISCLSCHHQAGVGGAGPNLDNVDVLTATPEFGSLSDGDREMLAKIHPGFRQAASVVIHRFGTDTRYAIWRVGMLGLDKDPVILGRPFPEWPVGVRLACSARSTPPLFGLGLVDAIPDAVIEGVAARKEPKFPEIKGRVSRRADGRIGRFGWKAEVATLEDFVLTACAGELGLEVPGHKQASALWEPEKAAPGLDLSEGECAALVAYVGSLPPPIERFSPWQANASIIEAGRAVFHNIGCAVCHVPTLGNVDGIYSDLLLHDMGSTLSGQGSYASGPVSPGNGPARPGEWRTPPLWGLSDSAPYLHDGRAPTIEKAITRHDGVAAASAHRFRRLAADQRAALRTFLLSLSAPPSDRHTTVPRARQQEPKRLAVPHRAGGLMSAPAAPVARKTGAPH